MSFGQAVSTCFGKYAVFSGRAPRSEYWWFFLFVILAGSIASTIDWMLFGTSMSTADGGVVVVSLDRQPVSSLTTLGVFLPHFAAAWRRMHDTGRSGFYVFLPSIVSFGALLIAGFGLGLADMASGRLDSIMTGTTLLLLIPLLILAVLSPLIVLWWLTRPSQSGANAYGPNPQEV